MGSSDAEMRARVMDSHGKGPLFVGLHLQTHALGAPLGAVATLAFGAFLRAILHAAVTPRGEGGRGTSHAAKVGVVSCVGCLKKRYLSGETIDHVNIKDISHAELRYWH